MSNSNAPPTNKDTASTMIRSKSPKAFKQVKLPPNWVPGKFDIICGRGSIAQQHEGNRRLKSLVQSKLPEYNASACKFQKSKLVSSIVEAIQAASPDGGFVKYMDDGWFLVTERHAREKVGQLFRDALFSKYKSSTKAKSKIRRDMKTAAVENNNGAGNPPDSGSISGGSDSPSFVTSLNETSGASHQYVQTPPQPIPSSITCLDRPLQQRAPPSTITSQKRKLQSPSSSSSGTGSISFLALNDLPNFEPSPLGEESMNSLFDDLDFHFLRSSPNTFWSRVSDNNIDQVCDYIYDQL